MKRNRTNKVLVWVFAMVMVISLLSGNVLTASAAAADDLTVTIDTGDEVTLKDTDGDGYYEIATADELYAFAAAVNGGNTAIHGKLTADILVNENVLTGDGALNGDGSDFRVWTPIGNSSQKYSGAFNGSGKTVSGLYFNGSANVGLFGYVTAAGAIENVAVSDSYFRGSINVGGIVGWTEGTVENCVNNSTIVGDQGLGGVAGVSGGTVTNCTNTGTVSGKEKIGGVVGTGSGTVEKCSNSGTVSGTGMTIGGVIGYNSATAKNCRNFGAISGSNMVGGIVGLNGKFVQYCYNVGGVTCVTGDYSGGVVGYIGSSSSTAFKCYYLDTTASGGINGRDVTGQAEARTAEAFASGEVAYLLGSPWGQNIDTEGTLDPYPVLNGYQVYCGYKSCGDTELQYSNGELLTEKPDHSAGAEGDEPATCAAPAYCSVCESFYGEADKTNHDTTVAYENGFCPNCDACQRAVLLKEGDVCKIYNAGQLYWFAAKVNSGETDMDGMLMADIVVNTGTIAAETADARVWTPIGNAGTAYTGTFDGNGKTISGLYCVGESFAGLFAHTGTGSVIRNLTIANSAFYGTGWAGAFAAYGNGTISNCTNAESIVDADGSNTDGYFTVGTDKISYKNSAEYESDEVSKCLRNLADEELEYVIIDGFGYAEEFYDDAGNSLVDGKVAVVMRGELTFPAKIRNAEDAGAIACIIWNNEDDIFQLEIITYDYNTGYIPEIPVGVISLSDGNKMDAASNKVMVVSSGTDIPDTQAGGIVGVSRGTIQNCINHGFVNSREGIAAGGIAGSSYGDIRNCANTGTVISADNIGGIVGSLESGAVSDCYYIDSIETSTPYGQARSAEAFASGEVAYLLQADQEEQVWGQTIGTDPYPVLGGEKVYLVYTCEDEEAYSNVNETIHEGYNEEGFCTACDDYEPAVLNEEDGVYEIYNAGQLYWFSRAVSSGEPNINGKLMADIVINTGVLAEMAKETPDTSNFREWSPIGTEINAYNGTFDGNGKTVSGLYYTYGDNFAGLFGKVDVDGTVQNVGVVDSWICAGDYSASVVGWNLGTVTDCYSTGSISGVDYIGGVTGNNDGTVSDCYNTGSVTGDDYVGGVAGNNDGTVTDCHNTGSVTGTSEGVGGVAGSNDGTVTNCYNTGAVTGTGYFVGGVAGMNNSTIMNCYNTGNQTGGMAVGGLVGCSQEGILINSHSTGTVSGSEYVGGVVGFDMGYSTIANCYFDSTRFSGVAVFTDPDMVRAESIVTNVAGKSTKDFASGEVAYLLHQGCTAQVFVQDEQTGGYDTSDRTFGGSIWGQTIGTDLYPVLDGAEVYMVKFCDGVTDVYSNTNENITHVFTDADLICDCGAQAVARIGSDYYLHIDAVEAQWGEGETLILLADVETDDCLDAMYPDMVLELNGKTLTNTGTKAGRKTGIVVATDASLTIRDSSAAGTGAVDSQTVAVANSGELTLEGGTMLGLGVNNYRIMTMNGGKIVTTGGSTAVQNMGSLTVNGGVIQAEGIAVTNEGDVTVNGGTITGKTAISSSVSDGETVHITLGNGQVSGTSEDILLSQRAAGRFEVRLTQVPEEAYTVYFNTDSYPFLFGYSSDTVVASADHWNAVNPSVLVDVNADGVAYAYLCDHTGSTHTTALPSGDVHVYTCTLCGTAGLYEDHFGGSSTCMDAAVCELCDGRYGELNPRNHTGVNHLERVAVESCGTPGYTGDTVCECGTLIAQGEVIPATGNHSDASDDGDHICDVCQTPDVTSHTGGTATCMAKAICSDCDAEYGEKDPQNHTGVNHTVGAEEATCTEPGYTGDTVCECGVIVEEGEVIPVTEHDFVDGECADCGAEDPDWEDPTDPTDPEDPTDPTDPEDPTDPTDPEDPTDPTDPEDPSDPTDPEDPSDPTDPEDPSDPTDPEDPTDPTDPEDPEVPVLDGIVRLAGKSRYETGFAIAEKLKELKGIDRFSAVIVAYGQNFPDALTGSYLAAVKDAPILLTEPSMDADVLTFIRENLVPGGKVYILGGTAAVSAAFESGAEAFGFDVQRLKGKGRYETNLEILKEAGVNATDEILIATGKNYADSLSASATGLPMLLVDTALTVEQKAFLEGTSKQFVILGGTGAVSAEVEAELDAIGDVTRVKGASRYGTSVEIAKRFFTAPDAAVLAYAEGFPDGLCGGPLAYCIGAPLILTSNENCALADEYVVGITRGAVTGGTARISDETVREIFDLSPDTPIVKP